MIWHKDMFLVLNKIKPLQLIQNIQIIACMKKMIYKCYRYIWTKFQSAFLEALWSDCET